MNQSKPMKEEENDPGLSHGFKNQEPISLEQHDIKIEQKMEGGWNKKLCSGTMGGVCHFEKGKCKRCGKVKP